MEGKWHGTEAAGFTAEGEDDLFRFSIDADKIALDIVDKVIGAAIAAGTAGAGSGAIAIDLPDLEGGAVFGGHGDEDMHRWVHSMRGRDVSP